MEQEILWLISIAFISGIMDASIGGGGLILIPALNLTGLSIKEAIATARIASLMDATMAGITHYKMGSVDFSKSYSMIPLVIVGSIIGALVTSFAPINLVKIVFVIFMLSMTILMVLPEGYLKINHSNQNLLIPAGSFIIGLFIGLFGAGLGTVIIIFMVVAMGLDTLKAIGTSQIIVTIANIFAFLSFYHLQFINLKIGLIAGVFALLGAITGAVIAHRLNMRILKLALVIMVLGFSTRILLGTF